MGDLVRRSDAIARLILALEPRIDAAAAPGRRARSARRRARRCAGAGRCARLRPGKPGASAGRACAAGSSAPATSRRKPNCCGRGRARPSRSCSARSPRSTSGAAAAATARPISACSPAGSPPAPTMARRTGWRAPPSPSIRHGISRSTPTRTPSCRPAPRWADAPPLQIHPRLREYGEAAPRGPLPRVRDRAEDRALSGAAARRGIAAGRGGARAPRHRPADAAFRAGRTRRACLRPVPRAARRSADRTEPGRKPPVERQTGDGLLHIRLEPLAAGQPRRASTRRTASSPGATT